MNNVYEFKKNDGEREGLHKGRLIDVDQPFDYEEVAAITGPEYIYNLKRDGMSFVFYEELKRNVAGIQVEFTVMPKYKKVSGFQVADDYYHHSGHSWAHIEDDGVIRVGIDNFTAKVFGPADKITLPAVGTALTQGEVGWVLTRNNFKAPMQSPMSGTVCAVNKKINATPEIANKDPYETGWLFLMEPSDLENNLKDLLIKDDCFQWLEKENQNLLKLLESRYERLAATGGGLVDDIYGHCPGIDWNRLVEVFLGTVEKS